MTQTAVELLYNRSGASAWADVTIESPKALTVDPAKVTLTAEAEAPAVVAMQRRGRQSMWDSGGLSSSVRSSGSELGSGMRVWPMSV